MVDGALRDRSDSICVQNAVRYAVHCSRNPLDIEGRFPLRILSIPQLTHIPLQERFPNHPDELYATCIARLVYYRYINPAIM